jgi:hypothetical protein
MVDIIKEPEPSVWQKMVSTVLSIICLAIVIYAVYNTYELFSLLFAIYFAFSCITINPKIVNTLVNTPMLTYYSIFLTITLLFSVDDFKNNRDLIALLVTNILICLAVFFTASEYIVYIFIFTNSYVVTRIVMYFLIEDDELVAKHNTMRK